MSEQNHTTPPTNNVVPPTPTTTKSATHNVAGLQGTNRALFPNNDEAGQNNDGGVATAPSDGPTPLRKRKMTYSVKKKCSDNKKGKSDPDKQLVKIVKIIPTGIKEPITGMVIIPTGFMMDKHIGDIMYKSTKKSIETKDFLETTEIVHRVVTAKDENGLPIQHASKDGTMYATKGVFLPIQPEDMDTEDKIQEILVNNFGPALWATIDAERFIHAKKKDLPRITDYKRDVITKTVFSDAIINHEDILVIAKMVLKDHNVDLSDWLLEEYGTLYTLFHEGQLNPKLVTQLNVPFNCLSVNDKRAKTDYDQTVENAKIEESKKKKAEFAKKLAANKKDGGN